jgi:hypothetical protein
MRISGRDDAVSLLSQLTRSGYRVFWHPEANRLAASPKYSASVMIEVTRLLGLTGSEEWKTPKAEL